VASSRPPRSGERPTGTAWSSSSACRTSSGTVSGTPALPGLRTRGATLHVLQQILGHRSLETTKLYLHPDTRHLPTPHARRTPSSPSQREGGPSRRVHPESDRGWLNPPSRRSRVGGSACPDWSPCFREKWATFGPPSRRARERRDEALSVTMTSRDQSIGGRKRRSPGEKTASHLGFLSG